LLPTIKHTLLTHLFPKQSKSTKCKDAIKVWLAKEKEKAARFKKEWEEELKNGASPEDMPVEADGKMHNSDGTTFTSHKDAKRIKLFCMIPPITKMDAKLNDFPMCEHLSLSTNNIEKIGSLAQLRNLKILSLARNNLKVINKLDDIGGSLEQLWLSYNQIDKLNGLSKLRKLKILYIGNNKISDWKEVSKLKENPVLEELVMIGNPCYAEAPDMTEARAIIIREIPTLRKLDGIDITLNEREAAEGGGGEEAGDSKQ